MANPKIEQRAYHGEIDSEAMARALVVQFDQGATRAHWIRGENGRAIVQVQARREHGDPEMTVTVQITPSATGVVISLAEQRWFGVAADLAKSGLLALLNPWNIIGELDDIARNVRRIQLRDELWKAVESYCRGVGAGSGVGPGSQRVTCSYCGSPNPVGELLCYACRAPLAEVQPIACPRCGFLNVPEAEICQNCSTVLKMGRKATCNL